MIADWTVKFFQGAAEKHFCPPSNPTHFSGRPKKHNMGDQAEKRT